MFDRNERQALHPWMPVRQRLADPSSEPSTTVNGARQALEEAFSAAPIPVSSPAHRVAQDGPAPTVIVKRKRAFVASTALQDSAPDVGEKAPAAADTEPDARVPRTFRVDAAAAFGTESADDATQSVVANTKTDMAAVADLVPIIPTRRSRRRAAPAVVTVVVSPDPQADAHDEIRGPSIEPREAEPYREAGTAKSPQTVGQSLELVDRIKRLDLTLSQTRQAHDFRFLSRGAAHGRPKRYVDLLKSIERLKAEAQVIRRAEASRTIRWIKLAMAQYGLTPADIGL